VHRNPDPRCHRRPEQRHPVCPRIDVGVGEPPLDLIEWQRPADIGQAAPQIARIEQGQPETSRVRGIAQGVCHRVGVVVASASRRVMQVVELPYTGHPGEYQLGVRRGRQAAIGVRVETGRDPVHLIPPGPERPGRIVGPTAQGPVKGVRVDVGKPREHQPVEPLVT
jgi:hypothetical protein